MILVFWLRSSRHFLYNFISFLFLFNSIFFPRFLCVFFFIRFCYSFLSSFNISYPLLFPSLFSFLFYLFSVELTTCTSNQSDNLVNFLLVFWNTFHAPCSARTSPPTHSHSYLLIISRRTFFFLKIHQANSISYITIRKSEIKDWRI